MAKKENSAQLEPQPEKKLVCGIILPISAMDGCSSEHWAEVHYLMVQAIEEAGYEPRLVSDNDAANIIQKEIVNNLYSNEMVVCDISGRNPNVMFELGMRLAFDKPTVVVRDDSTADTFDIQGLRYVSYPRSLRHSLMEVFKKKLNEAIIVTAQDYRREEPNTFLKTYGTFKVAEIGTTEVSQNEYVLKELTDIKRLLVDNKFEYSRSKFYDDIFNTSTNYSKTQDVSSIFKWIKNKQSNFDDQIIISNLISSNKDIVLDKVAYGIAEKAVNRGFTELSSLDEVHNLIKDEVGKLDISLQTTLPLREPYPDYFIFLVRKYIKNIIDESK